MRLSLLSFFGLGNGPRKQTRIVGGKLKLLKKRRNLGESYVSTSGKLLPAKALAPVDCTVCPLKCQTKLTEEERKAIFDQFWGLGDLEK